MVDIRALFEETDLLTLLDEDDIKVLVEALCAQPLAHLQTFVFPDARKCAIRPCRYIGHNKSDLRRHHIHNHFSKDEKRPYSYLCLLCNKKACLQKGNMKQHILTELGYKKLCPLYSERHPETRRPVMCLFYWSDASALHAHKIDAHGHVPQRRAKRNQAFLQEPQSKGVTKKYNKSASTSRRQRLPRSLPAGGATRLPFDPTQTINFGAPGPVCSQEYEDYDVGDEESLDPPALQSSASSSTGQSSLFASPLHDTPGYFADDGRNTFVTKTFHLGTGVTKMESPLARSFNMEASYTNAAGFTPDLGSVWAVTTSQPHLATMTGESSLLHYDSVSHSSAAPTYALSGPPSVHDLSVYDGSSPTSDLSPAYGFSQLQSPASYQVSSPRCEYPPASPHSFTRESVGGYPHLHQPQGFGFDVFYRSSLAAHASTAPSLPTNELQYVFPAEATGQQAGSMYSSQVAEQRHSGTFQLGGVSLYDFDLYAAPPSMAASSTSTTPLPELAPDIDDVMSYRQHINIYGWPMTEDLAGIAVEFGTEL